MIPMISQEIPSRSASGSCAALFELAVEFTGGRDYGQFWLPALAGAVRHEDAALRDGMPPMITR
jgi:hypothetical protein